MLDLLDQVENSLTINRVGIEEFSESEDFCNKPLYPRQKLLLKLIFLEELTNQEEDDLNYWIQGGRNGTEITISPNIRDRVNYLRENGYNHFREIVLVGGRRSSKGFCTGMALSKVMYDTLQLQDPGRYYGIDPDKDIYFSCVAGSESQAKEFQYADFSSTVESCKAFEPYLQKSLETEMRVATPEDLRRINQRKARGVKLDKDIAKLRGKALAANAGTLRGSATMGLAIDEMAHMIAGESKASADLVYNAAVPALDQFGKDGIIFCNPPEAPIWMADLGFKPIGDIQIGDKVIGWHKPEGKIHRELCESEVLNVMRREAPLVKVTMASGRSFRCTADHRWLTLSSGGNKALHGGEWYAPAIPGRKLAHVIDPTPDLPPSLERDIGWLAGMFDGEGHAARGQAVTIGQSRQHNPDVCKEIERVLDSLQISWTYDEYDNGGGCYRLIAGDGAHGKQMYTNLANWLNPVRRYQLVNKVLNTGRWRTEDRVISVEPDGVGEVVSLTTSTVNYVCNGYASRNCNSSPYSKTGMFYERYQNALIPFHEGVEPGEQIDKVNKNGSPLVMTLRYPSWALFEGYQRDSRWRKAITVSADYDRDEKNEDGTNKWSEDDRAQITIARAEEAANPETYKVERRGLFAEVTDAYLNPTMVDRAFSGVPNGFNEDGQRVFSPLDTNWGEGAINLFKYKFHLDPSSTTAGFGFAIAHLEYHKNLVEEEEPHVVFDLVKRWNPKDFPGETIKWATVINDILGFARIFRPYEITFDQFQSAEPIQTLNYALMDEGIEGIRVYEKTATLERNWFRAETFKTALNHGLVHIPSDTDDCELASDELKFLQVSKSGGRHPRVDKQSIGPVQTKDIADCIMECTETLIGNLLANKMRDRATQAVMSTGAQGGFRIGGADPTGQGNTSMHPQLENFYKAFGRQGEQSRVGAGTGTVPFSQGRVGNGRRGIQRGRSNRARGRF